MQSARISQEMEEEVFALMGGLLGLLEVLSLDTSEPLSARKRAVLDDALKLADKLYKRVDALTSLLVDPQEARFQAKPYSLARLVEHAVRGASWFASERGVRLVLPAPSQLEKQTVLIDAARVDRALRAVTDALVSALPSGSELALSVGKAAGTVTLTLASCADLQTFQHDCSRLLVLAWQALFHRHGGSLWLDEASFRVDIALRSGEAS